MTLILVVAIAVMSAIMLFGLVVGLGTLAIRWLALPAEPTEEAVYEPPAPAVVVGGDATSAHERAAVHVAAAALGVRARSVLLLARRINDHAEWIARRSPERAAVVRRAATAAITAAERARVAFAASDAAGVANAELAGQTAANQVEASAAGLPDWQGEDRRYLLLLTAALIGSLILAAGAMWLR